MTRHYAIAAWTLDDEPSGARTRLAGLLAELPGLLAPDERVTILARRGTRPFPAWPTHEVDIAKSPTWRRALAEPRRLGAALRAVDASLVELGTLPVPVRLPCPVSLTIHDVRDADGVTQRMPASVARWIVRRSVARAAHVVVPSRFTASRLRAFCGPGPRISVIPNGVDTPRMSVADRTPGGPIVLHVGHLEPRKNLEVLVDAIAACATRPELVLVGSDHGSAAGLRRRARSLGVADRVTIRGVVSDEELARCYESASVAAVPSTYEGFGLPALEALAHGRPVLVSDRGALPEVVGDVGHVVPADDAAAWSRAIDTAIGDDLPTDAARRREHALARSWRDAARRTLDVWRTTIRGVSPADAPNSAAVAERNQT